MFKLLDGWILLHENGPDIYVANRLGRYTLVSKMIAQIFRGGGSAGSGVYMYCTIQEHISFCHQALTKHEQRIISIMRYID